VPIESCAHAVCPVDIFRGRGGRWGRSRSSGPGGYVAYWGTYKVDEAAGVLIQHIESDVSNGYAGTEQRRPFHLVGDRLVIGDGKTWTRVLERAR
jgi:hypothetical protein